jgi:hypothetical protein
MSGNAEEGGVTRVKKMACAASVLAAMTSGCGSGSSTGAIAYVPQPASVADPARALQDTLLAADDAPIKVEVTDGYVLQTVLYNTGTAHLEGARFKDVTGMQIISFYGAGYRVLVNMASGDLSLGPIFKDIAIARRFVDAMAAAVARARAPNKP